MAAIVAGNEIVEVVFVDFAEIVVVEIVADIAVDIAVGSVDFVVAAGIAVPGVVIAVDIVVAAELAVAVVAADFGFDFYCHFCRGALQESSLHSNCR